MFICFKNSKTQLQITTQFIQLVKIEIDDSRNPDETLKFNIHLSGRFCLNVNSRHQIQLCTPCIRALCSLERDNLQFVPISHFRFLNSLVIYLFHSFDSSILTIR